MSEMVGGAVTVALFLLFSIAIFATLGDVWGDQSSAATAASQLQAEHLEATLGVRPAGAADCGYTVAVDNTGEVAITDFSQMDLLVQYTDTTNAKVAQRLAYGSGWTIPNLSPDLRNPGSWDPGETATISFSFSPPAKVGTNGVIIMVAPSGNSDLIYFSQSNLQGCYYLHNNPTPPTADTSSQGVLPLGSVPSSTLTLFNYDQNRDLYAGLLIQKGATSVTETDPARTQVWRTGPLATALSLVLGGIAKVDLWSALVNFQLGGNGKVTVFLRHFNGVAHVELGNATIFDNNWQGGVSDFVKRTWSIPALNYTIPAGDMLEVKVIVEPASAGNMWFAYDTTLHPAVVKLP